MLIDVVQDALARPLEMIEPNMPGYRRHTESLSRNLRRLFTNARKFTISDDIVNFAATTDYDVTKTALSRAHLPFDVMWIEWNNHVRLKAIYQDVDPLSPEKVGILMYRDGDDYYAFSISPLVPPKGKNGSIAVDAHVYRWNLNGIDRRDDILKHAATLPADEDMGKYAFGHIYNHNYQQLMRYIDVNANPLLVDYITEALAAHGTSVRRGMKYYVEASIGESAGDFRIILGILGMINSTDRMVEWSENNRHGRRMTRYGSRPYLSSTNVVMKVPKKEIRQKFLIPQQSDHGRRRHEVIGHWAQRLSTGRNDCRHEWTTVSSTNHICQKCGRQRWWRRSHYRGDASLGLVIKDYTVVGRHDTTNSSSATNNEKIVA